MMWCLCDITPRQLLQIAGDRLSPAYKDNWSAIAMVQRCSKWTMPCRRQSHGKPQSVCGRRRCILGARWRRSPLRKMPCGMAIMLSVRSFCWPSQRCLTRRARLKDGTWHGRIATSRMALHSTCCPDWRRRLSALRQAFVNVSWSEGFFLQPLWKQWTPILSAATLAVGAVDLRQFLFRPTRRHYATSARDLYLCSSSTPPGGGVHGMCGFNAAKAALSRL